MEEHTMKAKDFDKMPPLAKLRDAAARIALRFYSGNSVEVSRITLDRESEDVKDLFTALRECGNLPRTIREIEDSVLGKHE
jgi:hypothetical protein